jgi:hypothetical protein
MNLTEAVGQVKDEVERRQPRSTVDLRLPIDEGRWAGRFKVLRAQRVQTMLETLETASTIDDDDERAAVVLGQAAMFLVDSCQQMLMVQENGTGEPLTHGDGLPVRFDERFAEALELELKGKSGEAVVNACWQMDNGEVNDNALAGFVTALVEWMQNTARPIAGELLGESQAGRP